MDATAYCYWLQGHFELLEGPAPAWDATACGLALSRLDEALAASAGEAEPGRVDGFCNWMKGFAALRSEHAGGLMPVDAVGKIQRMLSQVFEHALPEPKEPPKEEAPPRAVAMC